MSCLPVTQTSGTTHRAARQMSGRGHVFELTDGLRVTLVLLTSGATLNPESTVGGASLHVLKGRVRVQAEDERWDLGPGDLIALLREPVTAMEEAAFLVTVAWPAGAGASEHEGGEVSSYPSSLIQPQTHRRVLGVVRRSCCRPRLAWVAHAGDFDRHAPRLTAGRQDLHSGARPQQCVGQLRAAGNLMFAVVDAPTAVVWVAGAR